MPKTSTPLLRRLLEGERTWGGLEVSRGQGIARYRLVVYPPGLTRDERVALRLWRAFPVWGLGLWLLIQAPLMAAGFITFAMAAATVTYLVVCAVLMMRTGQSRRRVRTLTAVQMSATPTAECDELRDYAEPLLRADNRLAAGEITAVAHEAEIWRVYDRMR